MGDTYQVRVIKERARARATVQGHRLGRFSVDDPDQDPPPSRAACLDCGAALMIEPGATDGNEDIHGPAVEHRCGSGGMIMDQNNETGRLRAIFPRILQALGNGSGCLPVASVEFMEEIPAEVRKEVDQLRELLSECLGELRQRFELVDNDTEAPAWCDDCKAVYRGTGRHADQCLITRLELAVKPAAPEYLLDCDDDPGCSTCSDVGSCDNEARPPCRDGDL
jgi:hypothetical protein